MAHCKECGRSLTKDEIALHKKIYNRGAEEFFCIDCSSRYLDVSVDLLRQKIVNLKKWAVRCLRRDIPLFRSVADFSEIVQGFRAFSKSKTALLSMVTQPFLLTIDSGRLFCFSVRNEAHSIGGYMRLLFEMDKRDYDNCTHRFVRNSARSVHNPQKKDCYDP